MARRTGTGPRTPGASGRGSSSSSCWSASSTPRRCTGSLTAAAVQQWGIAAFSAFVLVVVTWTYFSRRMLPAKYLVPGLVFLLVYQIFAMAYTGYVAFTNYGDGHNSTKGDAVSAILAQNERGSRARPASRSPSSPGRRRSASRSCATARRRSARPRSRSRRRRTRQSTDGKVTAVPGYDVLTFADIVPLQTQIIALRVPISDDPTAGSIRTQDARPATCTHRRWSTTRGRHDDGPDHRHRLHPERDRQLRGRRRRDAHARLAGRASGSKNFTQFFSDSRISGPFVEILLWTFAFAILSVVTTFALGLFLAHHVQRPADAGPQDLPVAADPAVRVPGVPFRARVARDAQSALRLHQPGAARGRRGPVAHRPVAGQALDSPGQPVARVPVHVPGGHRRPAVDPGAT